MVPIRNVAIYDLICSIYLGEVGEGTPVINKTKIVRPPKYFHL